MSGVIPQIAKQLGLPSGDMLRLFSSHSWAYSDQRDKLHEILRPWNRGIDFQDYSISSAHPLDTKSNRELADSLSAIIQRMDVFLLMAGMYLNDSYWMGFELTTAYNFKKPIIPVLANGQQRIPQLARDFAACEPVRWRSQSLRDAIASSLAPARRQQIETAFQRRANLDKIEHQRRALARKISPPSPTLVGGPSAFAPSPYTWPLPGGAASKAVSLAEALMGLESPHRLPGDRRGR